MDLFRGYAGNLLIAVDGTSYQSSNTINCEKCSVRQRKNGTAAYLHFVVAPARLRFAKYLTCVAARTESRRYDCDFIRLNYFERYFCTPCPPFG